MYFLFSSAMLLHRLQVSFVPWCSCVPFKFYCYFCQHFVASSRVCFELQSQVIVSSSMFCFFNFGDHKLGNLQLVIVCTKTAPICRILVSLECVPAKKILSCNVKPTEYYFIEGNTVGRFGLLLQWIGLKHYLMKSTVNNLKI